MEHCAMSKRALKKSKRRTKAVVPALGITGLFLSLASGATASADEATTRSIRQEAETARPRIATAGSHGPDDDFRLRHRAGSRVYPARNSGRSTGSHRRRKAG